MAKLRSKQQIAERIVALVACYRRAYQHPRSEVARDLAPTDVLKFLSPRERDFYKTRRPAMRLRIEHSWGIEGAATLLWAMGLGDKKLSAMNVTCSPDLICDLVRELNISGMVKKAKVLSSQAIDRELEGVETAHWKVRDAALRGKPTPKTLEPDLILLRHHSLNWLTRYTNDDWDDVPTDT